MNAEKLAAVQNEEKEKEMQKKINDFLSEVRVVEDKYNLFVRPIITQDGPRIMVDIKNKENADTTE